YSRETWPSAIVANRSAISEVSSIARSGQGLGDVVEATRLTFDPLEVRIAKAVMVIDLHGAHGAAVLDDQLDRRGPALGRRHCILQHVGLEAEAVDGDDLVAGREPRLERGAAPDDVADRAVLLDAKAERELENRRLVELLVGRGDVAGRCGVDQAVAAAR